MLLGIGPAQEFPRTTVRRDGKAREFSCSFPPCESATPSLILSRRKSRFRIDTSRDAEQRQALSSDPAASHGSLPLPPCFQKYTSQNRARREENRLFFTLHLSGQTRNQSHGYKQTHASITPLDEDVVVSPFYLGTWRFSGWSAAFFSFKKSFDCYASGISHMLDAIPPE